MFGIGSLLRGLPLSLLSLAILSSSLYLPLCQHFLFDLPVYKVNYYYINAYSLRPNGDLFVLTWQVLEKLLEISSDYWNTFLDVPDENLFSPENGGSLLGGMPTTTPRRRSIVTRGPLPPRSGTLSFHLPFSLV